MKRTMLSILVGHLLVATVGLAQAQEGTLGTTEKGGGRLSARTVAADSDITVDQVARLQEKLRLIEQIMRASSADIQARPNASEAAKWARESLYGMSLEQVSAVGAPTTFQALSDSITKARVMPKTLGSASSDLVFFPFPPCRYIDTRNVGGKISGARGFDFALAGNTYGGAAACNLTTLSGATQNQIAAVSLNMTIVDTSTAGAPGFATARPAGATALTALVNWTVSSAGFQLGNAAVITTDQSGGANELEIFTSGAVHAIVDVAGVFAAPTATALSCTTVTGVNTPFPANSANTLAPAPACTAGYTAVSLECESSTNASRVLGLNAAGCFFANDSASASTVRTDTKCCRVPGR